MGAKSKEKIVLDPKTAAVFERKGYDVTDKISEGAFGKVYKARKTDDGSMSAVKVMDILLMPAKFVDLFLPRELEMLQKIHHKYVLDVFDIFRSNKKIYIFMEFAPNGDLTKQCKAQPIPENKAKIWFEHCASALQYMHSDLNICHRDIKTDNVLLDKNNEAKLSDFGFARVIEDDDGMTRTVCGTVPYYSPELALASLNRSDYNAFKGDCWAMGVMLFVMLTSKWPFMFPTRKGDKGEWKDFVGSQMKREYRSKERYQNLTPQARSLIDSLLDPKPDRRYGASDILSDPWIKRKGR